jgi:hypothetical protein
MLTGAGHVSTITQLQITPVIEGSSIPDVLVRTILLTDTNQARSTAFANRRELGWTTPKEANDYSLM